MSTCDPCEFRSHIRSARECLAGGIFTSADLDVMNTELRELSNDLLKKPETESPPKPVTDGTCCEEFETE